MEIQATIRLIADDEIKTATEKIFSSKKFQQPINDHITEMVQKESLNIASANNPSMLAKTDPKSLLEFTDEKFVEELRQKALVLYQVLFAAVVTRKRYLQIKRGEETDAFSKPAISMAASVLLKNRDQKLCAQAYRVGFILHHSGAKNLVSLYFILTDIPINIGGQSGKLHAFVD